MFEKNRFISFLEWNKNAIFLLNILPICIYNAAKQFVLQIVKTFTLWYIHERIDKNLKNLSKAFL